MTADSDQSGTVLRIQYLTDVTATADPLAGTLMLRDASGRVQAANPAAGADIATKSYVDTAVAGTVVADSSVSNAKLADVASGTLKGRISANIGDPEDLSAVQVRSLLNVADGATAAGAAGDAFAATHAGSGGSAHAIATAGVAGFMAAADKAKLDAATTAPTAATLVLRDASGRVQVANPAAGADVATKGYVDTAITSAAVADNAVSNAKLADVVSGTLKGRISANAGDPEDLSAAQVRSLLNVADGATAAGAAGDAFATAHAGSGGGTHAIASAAGFMAAADKSKLDAATSAPTAATLMLRDTSGRVQVASPAATNDVTNKAYVDTAVAGVGAPKNRRVLFGAMVDPSMFAKPTDSSDWNTAAEPFGQLVAAKCDIITFPYGSIGQLQGTQGVYNWAKMDAMVNFAQANGLKLHNAHLTWSAGQTASWFNPTNLPTPAAGIAAMQSFIRTVMTRYKGKVHAYNVCNEIFWSDAVGGQSKYLRKCGYTDVIGADWPRYAFEAAREADPDAILVLNEYDVEKNANSLGPQKRAAMLNLIDDFLRRGVPIDAVGIQGHCYEVWWNVTYGAAAWAQFLRDIADRGLRIYITEFDLPDGGPNNPDINRLVSVANDYLSVALDCPAVDVLIAWGLNKIAAWQTGELRKLFTDCKPRVLPPPPSFGGTWNPSTNTPTFANGALVNGQPVPSGTVYTVAASGTQTLDGVTVSWIPQHTAGAYGPSGQNATSWRDVANNLTKPCTGMVRHDGKHTLSAPYDENNQITAIRQKIADLLAAANGEVQPTLRTPPALVGNQNLRPGVWPIGPKIQALGGTIASQCGRINPYPGDFNPAYQYPAHSPLTWVQALSRGAVTHDLDTGYGGPWGGAVRLVVESPGKSYANPTIALSGTNYAPGVVTAKVSAGGISAVAITDPGKKASSDTANHVTVGPITATVTDASGSGAIITPVVGGTGTLGSPEQTTANILARVDDAVNCTADVIVVFAEAKDVIANVSATTTVDNLARIYTRLMDKRKLVVAVPIPPIAGLTSAQRDAYNTVNRWIRAFCTQRDGQNPSNCDSIVLADPTPWLTDQASATGDPIVNAFYSSGGGPLITGPIAAMAIGQAIWEAIKTKYPAYSVAPRSYSQSDVFSTGNKGGALNPNFLLTGTTNAATYVTSPWTAGASNYVPTGDWKIWRAAGSATGTFTVTVDDRTDGVPGKAVTITVSCGGGTAAEQFIFGVPTQTLAAANVAAGDYVYAEADILWFGLANLNQLVLRLQQTTSDAAPNNQIFAYCGGPNGFVLPTGTQILAASQGYVPLRTPPMKIETVATSLSWGLDFGFKADGTAGSASAVLKIANFALRKAKVV